MTNKAEIENLSAFGTVKYVYFFMYARTTSTANSFFQSQDSISLPRFTCKHEFHYWIVLMVAIYLYLPGLQYWGTHVVCI